jgi:hypothetical protein
MAMIETQTKPAPGDRMRAAEYPPIIPVEDKFTLTARKKMNGRIFAEVANPLYKDAQAVFEWAQKSLGGHWMIPTIHMAGRAWQLNPQYGEHGWTWLIIKV